VVGALHVEEVKIPERVAGFGDAGGDSAGVQPCLFGAECAEHCIGDLARHRLMHLGDAIGDRGRVGISRGGHR